MGLSEKDIERIAQAAAEKAVAELRTCQDAEMALSSLVEGAIPLYGRETRREPCKCCLIDPAGPNAPENRMCTTKGAIGTLTDAEERAWCSEITIIGDGRCGRARKLRQAARECKEKHPGDTRAFFQCYAPAFSSITKT